MKYGCIGKKLSHSFSKIIHNQLCDYEYELVEIAPEDLNAFMQKKDFCAINVTIPYKTEVIPYLDSISDTAKQIGAVNTVVNRGGKLYGYNTDFFGMRTLMQKNGIDPNGKKCAILGTGGTSKTATAVLESMGAKEILTVSRTQKPDIITYAEFEKNHRDTQIIINTTPCGMYPNISESAVDIDGFYNLCGAVDAVYNPLKTEFVLNAQKKGAAAVGGLYMLVTQAAAAAEKFIDTKIAQSEIDRVYNKLLFEKQNIVLVGMPSVGKSTLGRSVAKALGLEFYDSDTEIKKQTKKTIPEIFKDGGENAFRKIEKEVIFELSKKTGCVIATGGGAVLFEANVKNLRQNGKLILIDRPLDSLCAGEGRPLAPDNEHLLKLYNERMPIYTKVCDIHIKLSGDILQNTQTIIERYKNDSND